MAARGCRLRSLRRADGREAVRSFRGRRVRGELGRYLVVGDIDVGHGVTHVAVGFLHACAILTTGAVRCWGRGSSAALGYGNVRDVGDDETPASAGDVPVTRR